MPFGLDPQQLAFLLLVAVAAGGAVLALALPLLSSSEGESRVKSIAAKSSVAEAKTGSASGRLIGGQKDNRRRQIQDSLKQIEDRAQQRKRGVSLRAQIGRAGLGISVRNFWVVSGAVGLAMALLPLLLGLPIFVGFLSGIAGLLGLPRWFLSYMSKRRQNAFLRDLPDALDVMVRGLKAGLPLSDAMRVIATEAGPPIAPEFMEIVEGQRLGVTIDQGLERMFERMPLPEVSFLGIVISIQSKSGGNLSEALGNLSRVLRDRKKMKGKVRAMAQEAKSSAAIIGALPFLIVGAIFMLSPKYLEPLFTTDTGHLILIGCGVWMLMGVLTMRKMINFDI
ncbi:MAG: type II secretion system F family protein [Aestuariivirga sp.]|uniref:type II secretion system F family protein n=1 Tax=Aestuariivirga sp. TaxID=2650926 RepID=UPI003017ECDD